MSPIFGASFLNQYLTKRTVVPIIVDVNLIIIPEETRKGTNKPISRVSVFNGLGNLIGDNVASSKPTRYPQDIIWSNENDVDSK